MRYTKKNPLLRWINEEGVWLVEESLSAFYLDIAFKVEIGFKTDLASIPQLFRSLIPQIGRHIQAAIFHDLIYRTKEHFGLTRLQADEMFLAGMKYSDVRYTRRYIIYWAVRIGGRKAWKSKKYHD